MKKSVVFLLGLSIAGPTQVLAAENESKHEVEGSTSTEIIFKSHDGGGTGDARDIDAKLGYSYTIQFPFQISTDLKLSHDEFKQTTLQAHVGPTFNFFGHSVEDSCFVGAALGFSHYTYGDRDAAYNGNGPTTLSAIIRSGVRVPISTHLSWKPNAQFYWQAAGYTAEWMFNFPKRSLSIVPLAFAFSF